MTKEQTEHISIILDSVAFFFVTVDLYGKERLENLRSKIVSIKPEQAVNSKRTLPIKILFSISIAYIYFAIQYFILRKQLSHPDLSNGFTSKYILDNAIPQTWGDGFLAVSAIIIGWNYKFFLVQFPKKIMVLFLRMVIKFNRLFRIEGVMLFAGAILFVIAKIMQYFSV